MGRFDLLGPVGRFFSTPGARPKPSARRETTFGRDLKGDEPGS